MWFTNNFFTSKIMSVKLSDAQVRCSVFKVKYALAKLPPYVLGTPPTSSWSTSNAGRVSVHKITLYTL